MCEKSGHDSLFCQQVFDDVVALKCISGEWKSLRVYKMNGRVKKIVLVNKRDYKTSKSCWNRWQRVEKDRRNVISTKK